MVREGIEKLLNITDRSYNVFTISTSHIARMLYNSCSVNNLPALNHEMVRAVLTERQTRDCDVKCRITFNTKGNYCLRMWNSKH